MNTRLALCLMMLLGCSESAALDVPGSDKPPRSDGNDEGDGIAADGEPDEGDGAGDGDGSPAVDAGTSNQDGDDAEDASAPPDDVPEDYLVRGPEDVAMEQSMATGGGCSFEAVAFRPRAERSDVALVLVPGFALAAGLGSSRDALDTLAEHVASWGITTYTLGLCTNGGSIDHAMNGAAMAAFGESLGREVVYAGFSAGGLAAMLAARDATNARGLLALDAVDSGTLGKLALDGVRVPVHALVGEPSNCNSSENMLAVYQGRDVRVLKINGAQHFIFEGAACTGIKCALCNGGGEEHAQAVRALSTAFVLGISGTRVAALKWWQSGSEELTALSASGMVSEVQ